MIKSLLFINYEYPPIGAGAANATYNIATAMAKRGNRVCVVTSAFGDKSGQTEEDGVTVFRLPAFRRHAGRSSLFQMLMYVIAVALRLPSIIKRHRPGAAIIFFAFPCGPIGLLLKYRWRIPYLLMLRGGDVPGFEPSLDRIHRLLRPVRRAVYHGSSAITANSNGLRDLALQSDTDAMVGVIPNGVDTDFFQPAGNRTGTSQRSFTFLFAGRICIQKNLDVLIDAFSQCRSDGKDLRLTIIGEGPELVRLRQLAKSRMLESAIEWVGWCIKEELRSHYHSADCFVNPSTKEGMSNAVLEAMACGLPVVAGDCPGNREIIRHGVDGLLFDPENSALLADAMQTLAEDRGFGERLGNEGRASCCSNYSWHAATRQLNVQLEQSCFR